MQYLLLSFILITAFIPVPDVDGWAFRQMLGLAVLSVGISFKLYKKFHWSVALCFLSTTLNCLYHKLPGNMVQIVLFSCAALIAEDNLANTILPLLSFVALGDALIMISRYLASWNNPWGFKNAWWVLTNSSLDACFIALMLPTALLLCDNKKTKIFLASIIVLALLAARGNTGIVTLIVMSLAYLIASKQNNYSIYAGIIAGAASLVGFMWYYEKLGVDNGRFGHWKLMMSWWEYNANAIIGTGPGTFWGIAYAVQPDAEKFMWMHNDWLQQLFTHGILGLLLVAILYGFMLKNSIKSPVLFSMVVGYGLIAVTQFPNHLFFFQLVGVLLIYHCFDKTIEGTLCQMPSPQLG